MVTNSNNTNFKKWACSFSGCDGGNPDSDIWLCGIEWGYAKRQNQSAEDYETELMNYYQREVAQEIKRGEYTPEGLDNCEGHLKSQFDLKVAKLYTILIGENLEKHREIAKREIYCKEGKLFKLNLYPVAFQDDNDEKWKKYGLDEITGLENKHIYRTWCFLHRFPVFHQKVLKHKPKIIIGTGTSYLTDHVVAFAGNNGDEMIHKHPIKGISDKNTKERTIYWTKIKHPDSETFTLLAVTPFLGSASGLNSDYLIKETAEFLREKLIN